MGSRVGPVKTEPKPGSVTVELLSEKELIEKSGYSGQQLLNFRKGRKTGKYEYPPVLEEGMHYLKFGGGVAYTKLGVRVVMQRALKKKGGE